MLWIIVIVLPLLLLSWFLLSRIEFQIDSRISRASIHWAGVGWVLFEYADETWWIKIQVLFFRKKWPLSAILSRNKKKGKPRAKRKKEHGRKQAGISKILRLIRSFKVVHWQIAIDTNDAVHNAWLYSLNFPPYLRRHIFINFQDINYFTLIIRNTVWRLLYAWIR